MSDYKLIKNFVKKPSEALGYMIQGLLEQNNRRGFIINMTTFGEKNDRTTCIGCAATCAIQKIMNKDYSPATIDKLDTRAQYLEIIPTDLMDFENAIDQARRVNLQDLFVYFDMHLEYCHFEVRLKGFHNFVLSLQTRTWKENLWRFQILQQYLKFIGH